MLSILTFLRLKNKTHSNTNPSHLTAGFQIRTFLPNLAPFSGEFFAQFQSPRNGPKARDGHHMSAQALGLFGLGPDLSTRLGFGPGSTQGPFGSLHSGPWGHCPRARLNLKSKSGIGGMIRQPFFLGKSRCQIN